jgi:predicted ATPase
LLTSRDPTVVSRQQTLERTIRWSYDLLTPEERTVFDQLSVFVGGWSLGAVEAVVALDGVTSSDGMLDILQRLIDKSLVLVDRPSEGPTRYHLLEPLRQFAHDRLEETGEGSATCQRHAEWFLALFEEAEPEIVLKAGPDPAWIGRMDPDFDNLRAALRSLITRGDAERAQRLVGSARPLWFTHGHLAEGRRWFEETLALDPAGDAQEEELTAIKDATGLPARAKVLMGLGQLAVYQGDLDAAETAERRGLRLYRLLGDELRIAFSLYVLGFAAELRADFAGARCF